jgi:ParB/RepB/Spo0J family partition protein
MAIKALGKKKDNPDKPSRKNRVLGFIGEQLNENDKHAGDGQLDYIPINKIRLTDQPRKLGISVDDVISHAEGLKDLNKEYKDKKLDAFKELNELAQSIKNEGLIQPITAYESGDEYLLVAGERRFLAHVLLKAVEIRALVKPKPADFKLAKLKLIENVQRKDLNLAEMIDGLIVTNELFMKENDGRPMKRADFMKAISVSGPTATRYSKVIQGPSDVIEAIKNQDIKQLTVAAEIAEVEDADSRQEMIKIAKEGHKVTDTEEVIKKSKANAKKKKKGVGRSLTSVTLGKTTNTGALKKIIETCASAGITSLPPSDMNWSDFSQVRDAWTAFMDDVQKKASK